MYKINYSAYNKKIIDSLIMIAFLIISFFAVPYISSMFSKVNKNAYDAYDSTIEAKDSLIRYEGDKIVEKYYIYEVDEIEYKCEKEDKNHPNETDKTIIHYKKNDIKDCYYVEPIKKEKFSIKKEIEHIKKGDYNIELYIKCVIILFIIINIINLIINIFIRLSIAKLGNSKTAILITKLPYKFVRGKDTCPEVMLKLEDESTILFKADRLASLENYEGEINGLDLLFEPNNIKKYYIDFNIGRLKAFDNDNLDSLVKGLHIHHDYIIKERSLYQTDNYSYNNQSNNYPMNDKQYTMNGNTFIPEEVDNNESYITNQQIISNREYMNYNTQSNNYFNNNQMPNTYYNNQDQNNITYNNQIPNTYFNNQNITNNEMVMNNISNNEVSQYTNNEINQFPMNDSQEIESLEGNNPTINQPVIQQPPIPNTEPPTIYEYLESNNIPIVNKPVDSAPIVANEINPITNNAEEASKQVKTYVSHANSRNTINPDIEKEIEGIETLN